MIIENICGEKMRADEVIKRYTMEQHIENGAFIERHYDAEPGKRAESGSIYYYVAPGEITEFHRIDCDEYWCYNAGSTIEIWSFDNKGSLKKHQLGITEGAEPVVFFRRGEIFASRLSNENSDGTFITCITVPRFTYDGFEKIEKEEMIKMYPDAAEFWK